MGDPSNTLTFDQTIPRRPGVDDLGGASQQNDPRYPPKAGMPTAEMANQAQKLGACLGGLVPVAIVSVRFSSGTPVIDLYVEARSIPVQPTLTDLGNGDTKVSWATYPFPAPVARPGVDIAEDIAMLAPVAVAVSGGYEVKTRNSSGTLTDCAFVLKIY